MLEEFSEEKFDFKEQAENVEITMAFIKAIRNMRAEKDIKPSKKIDVKVLFEEEKLQKTFKNCEAYLTKMASLGNLNYITEDKINKEDTVIHLDGMNIYLDLSNIIDKEEELKKLEKELSEYENELKRANGMLSNERFVAKAPKELIEKEKEKQEKYNDLIQKVKQRIEELQKM